MNDERIKNFRKELGSADTDEERVNVYADLIRYLIKTNHPDLLSEVDDADKFADSIGSLSLKADIYNAVGEHYRSRGDYESAIDKYSAGIEEFEVKGYLKGVARLKQKLAYIKFVQLEFDEAMELCFDSINLCEENDFDLSIVPALNTLAGIYFKMGDFDNALQYILQAHDIVVETGSIEQINTLKSNIGNIYADIKHDYKKALEYLEPIIDYTLEKGSKVQQSALFNNLSNCYKGLGEYDKALQFSNKELAIIEELGNKMQTALTLESIGELHYLRGDFEKSIVILNTVLEMAEEPNWVEAIMNSNSTLSAVYEKLGDYKNALEYFKKFRYAEIEYADSELKEKISEMKTKFETERKEKEAEIYRLRNVELASAKEKIEAQHTELAKAYEKLEEISRIDPLTGLWNRRYFQEIVKIECHRSERSGNPFSIGICDIDYFKQINDTYGHECGDVVLEEISKLIRESIRKQDSVGRWGGEEFILLLPETKISGALVVAEKLRKKIESINIIYEGKSVKVTMSFGVAESENRFDVASYIRNADRAMYSAKKAGRNSSRAYKTQ